MNFEESPIRTVSSEMSLERDRFTVTFQGCLTGPTREQIAVRSGGERLLESSGEECYQRGPSERCKATEEWQELDMGWVSPALVGYIILENLESRARGNVYLHGPSQAAREQLERHTILITQALDKESINPDQSWRAEPEIPFFGSPGSTWPLWVKCLHGEAHYRLTVIPA